MMVSRKTKLNEIRTDVISSYRMNIGKKKEVETLFRAIRMLKNKMSLSLYGGLDELFLALDDKAVMADILSRYKFFECSFVQSWELQSMYHDIVKLYSETLKRRKKNTFGKLRVQSGSKAEYFKRDTANNKKGDLKSFSITLKETGVTKLVKYLGVFGVDDDTILESLSEKYSVVYDLLNYYKNTKPDLYQKAVVFATKLRTKVVKSVGKMVFTTGSHRRIPVIGATVKSEIVFDPTNTKFPYWYALEVPKRKRGRICMIHGDEPSFVCRKPRANSDLIWLPLEYNKAFHGDIMNHYATSSVLTVTYREGKLRIGLMREADEVVMKEKQRAFGGDVGTARWLLALRGEDGTSIGIEADQQRSRAVIKRLMQIDKRLGEAAILKNSGRFNESIKKEALARRQMKNVVQSNQRFMEIFASRLLDLMNTENITDLTLENLELNLTVSSDVHLNGIKLTRLVRMLKLSSFKTIMKDQALKRGIRIHLVCASYTSQECPSCHTVDRRNRNKDVFKCISCGLENEADFNAGGTILGRTEVEKLHIVDENGCIVPKKLKRGTIKNIVSELTEPYSFIDKSGCSAPIRRYKPMIDSTGRFVLYCSADGEKLKLSENKKTSVRELLAVA